MEPVGPAGSVSWNLRALDPDSVVFLYQDVDFFYPVAFYVTTDSRKQFWTLVLSHLVGAPAADASCQWHMPCVTRRPHSVEPAGPAESVGLVCMRMWEFAYALLVFYFLTNGKTAMHEYIGNMIFFMAALMLMETTPAE